MRSITHLHHFAFALATLLLVACAEAGSEGAPGDMVDGNDVPEEVDAGGDDALITIDAARDEVDAALDDRDSGPSTGAVSVALVSPENLQIAHGHAATVTVVLDGPAGESGEAVVLTQSGGLALEMPNHVVVQPGLTSATFQVTGASIGGPFTVTAQLGATKTASARVLPALTSVSGTSADVLLGAGGLYTVALESATSVAMDVTLTSAVPGVVSVPAKVTIPAGQTAASFAVTGLALSGLVNVTASMGGQDVVGRVRVLGLFLSEVFYDATSEDDKLEWIELYNASSQAIDLAGVLVQSANMAAPAPFKTSLTLSGSLPAGGCIVVGGPNGATGFVYAQAGDFNPDLGNVGTNGFADGIQLVAAAGGIVDNVLYGLTNGDQLTDENGVVAPSADVGDALPAQTIERTATGLAGPWQVQVAPSPGNCSPIAP